MSIIVEKFLLNYFFKRDNYLSTAVGKFSFNFIHDKPLHRFSVGIDSWFQKEKNCRDNQP